MKPLEKKVLDRLKRRPQKRRYTFFLSEHVKDAFAEWCSNRELMESPTLEQMLLELLPEELVQKALKRRQNDNADK
jgi:hypothetical protein